MKLLVVPFVLASLAFAQLPYVTAVQPAIVAQEIPANRGSAALWQSLKKLHTRASLIMITAHPDDEDGGMLTYESRGQGTRVALLTLNRGEGGANVMSPDYFDALGLVRTMELLAAGRYYGVDQYWTRVIDYGFSKTKAESISKWTHDRVLYDVVRVVRTVRPLVVTSVFVGGPSDGHGNHQTAGAMAQEVFKAAGDPNVFPDQIKAGLQPWTPIKDYARQPFSRRGGSNLPVNVQIPEGTYDPMLGMSYVQLSREGLGFQKSQNGGSSIPKAGQMLSGYHRFGSTISAQDKEKDFFDGIDTSLLGIASLAESGDTGFLRDSLTKINSAVEDATAKFSAVQPEVTAPALAAGLKQTLATLDALTKSNLSERAKYDVRHELEIKRVQFNNALGEALG
ncbi:MAG: PIG-L family deacetylase [Bryobacteraceae bacterium]